MHRRSRNGASSNLGQRSLRRRGALAPLGSRGSRSLLKALVRAILQSETVDVSLCTRLYALLRQIHSTVGIQASPDGAMEDQDEDDGDEPDSHLHSKLLIEALHQCQHPSPDTVASCPTACSVCVAMAVAHPPAPGSRRAPPAPGLAGTDLSGTRRRC